MAKILFTSKTISIALPKLQEWYIQGCMQGLKAFFFKSYPIHKTGNLKKKDSYRQCYLVNLHGYVKHVCPPMMKERRFGRKKCFLFGLKSYTKINLSK